MEPGRQQRPRGAGALALLEPLASWRGVLAFWAAYCLAHAILRFSLSSTLSLDDARASELAQTLSLGYQVRQPPLYEWLLWTSQQALGTSITSHLLVRYLLIFALGLAAYGATKAATKDAFWSAVASISIVLMYPIGWAFHEWGTQSLLCAIACLLTWQAVLRFQERPTTSSLVFLGVAVGVGLLSKFNYALCLVGIAAAIVSLPEARRRFADARLLAALAIAFAMAAPYLLWLAKVEGNATAVTLAHLTEGGSEPHGARALLGLKRFLWSLPAFLMPWLLIVALLAGPAFRWRAAAAPPASLAARLTLRAMVVAAVVCGLGILVVGAPSFGERYVHPILIAAPVYVFARIVALAPQGVRGREIVAVVLAFACSALVIRAASFRETVPTRSKALPYEALAQELARLGVTSGTLVGATVRDAGNLRAFQPGLRVTAPDSYRVEPVPLRPSDRASCVLVWAEGHLDYARSLAPIPDTGNTRIDARMPASFGGWRAGTWWLARLDPATPACRLVSRP